MNGIISEKLKKLPNSPGVYFHKNSKGEIIYVGKAANLKNRVRQYFQNSAQKDAKTRALVAEIADIDWQEVESEVDALFLESEMIKRYKPQFNILLRDDKSSTFVRINFNEKLPYVSFTRAPLDDGAEYFGPFYNGVAIKKSLKLLRKIFPYYTSETLPRKGNLDWQIGLNFGLENFEVGSPEFSQQMKKYKLSLRNLSRYLRGERKKIQLEIEAEMLAAAKNQEFENAAEKRNQLKNLSELSRQIVFSREEFLDISKDIALSSLAELLRLPTPPRRIECYDISHIGGQNVVASMVVFTNGLSDRREYRKFKMSNQKNDDFAQMQEVLTRRFSPRNKKWTLPDMVIVDGGKAQLSAAIEIVPKNILVIGIAKRNEEIVLSRLNQLTEFEGILLDSQNRPFEVRQEGDFLFVNLHPNQYHSSGHSRNLLGESSSEFSDLTKFFQRIRDESHRFAINFHSTLRSQSQTKNRLENILGVGPKTRAKILKKFGSIKSIEQASEEQISEIVGLKLAKIIKDNLKS